MQDSSKSLLIKTIYFYLVSLISLFMVVFSTSDVVNLCLRTWIFPKAALNEYREPPCAAMITKVPDINETEEQFQNRIMLCEQGKVDEKEALSIRNQRDAVRDISLIVVGLPLFLYHWLTIRREKKEGA
ncbi:MAG: hypothetical protein ABIB04_02365 [Patescibacteria group bacterium]